jgi:lipid A 4'-phosphatase
MRFADHKRLTRLWLVAFVLATAIFALWPGIDLVVSGVFFTPGEGFTLSRSLPIEILREFVWTVSILVALAAAAAFVAALAGRPVSALDLRRSGFILSLYLLGPALLVDGLLKRFWGRARPANVEAFGGSSQFTPPWLPAQECANNCSFVSGEGAAATALAISLAVMAPAMRRMVPPWAYRTYVALAVILPATGLVLRVTLGRHFLSDTVFAMLFVSGIALVLARLLLTPRQP